jgi:hypothetical protein
MYSDNDRKEERNRKEGGMEGEGGRAVKACVFSDGFPALQALIAFTMLFGNGSIVLFTRDVLLQV